MRVTKSDGFLLPIDSVGRRLILSNHISFSEASVWSLPFKAFTPSAIEHLILIVRHIMVFRFHFYDRKYQRLFALVW